MKTFKEFLEEAYLVEMRKEDKVKGKKKTPLSISTTHKTVERAPEESGKKWERKDIEIKKGNPLVTTGRYRQGARGGSEYGYKRHPHGGEHGGMSAGSRRGVKKVPGEKKPEVGHVTPAQKVANKKARQANLSYLFGQRR